MNRVETLSSHLQDNRYVRVEKRGTTGLIRLLDSAPPRSQVGGCVLNAPMRAQILRALRVLESDASCLVIVLASTSERYFSSGIDIANFADGFVSDAAQQPPVPSLSELCAAVEACPKVCIAAVQGLCSSWGLELALAADYRVAAVNVKFRFPEVSFGITPCGGGARRLVCRVGTPQALEMLCYGRPVFAEAAYKMGLIDVPACEGVALWEELTRFILSYVAAPATAKGNGLATLEQDYAAKAVAQQRRRSCPAFAQLPFFNRGWYAWMEHRLRESVPRARQAPYRAVEAVRIAVTHSRMRPGATPTTSTAAAAGQAAQPATRPAAQGPCEVRDAAYAAAERKLFELCLASSEAQATQHLLRASQRTSMMWGGDAAPAPPSTLPPAAASTGAGDTMPTSVHTTDANATATAAAAAAAGPGVLPHRSGDSSESSLGLRKVAVLGAGTMGTSIALMLLWQRELEQVVLIENDAARQERAVRAIEAHLRSRVSAHRLSAHRCDDMLGRLQATGDPNCPFPPLLAEMDMVFECAPEVAALKQNIFAHLDGVCKRSAILVTVSSAQDVDALAAVTRRAGQVIGMHCFPPANHSPVVEVIRGAATERWVVERLMQLFCRLDKFPVVSLSRHGHVGTRLLLAALYQAYAMLEDGCFPLQIDFALRKTFHFRRGIFELEDIMGLDATAIVRASMLRGAGAQERVSESPATSASPSVRAALSPTKEIPASVPSAEEVSNRWWLPRRDVFDIPNSMIACGALGRKTREGWYTYAKPEECTLRHALRHPLSTWLWLPSSPSSEVPTATATTADGLPAQAGTPPPPPRYRFPLVSLEALVPQHNYSVEYRTLDSSKRHKCTRRPFRDSEIVERIVFSMVNEAAKMMDDGVITSSADIDCLSVYAFGFPAWKGGLCYYADKVVGLAEVVYKMKVYQRALGSEEFPFPCLALQNMLAKGELFASFSKE